jgi:type IV secretion system protein VirB4
VGGFGLSVQEYLLLKEGLEPGSRMFLIKQGHHSVVCQLDLQGFDAQLRVISGRASEVEYVHRLIASNGSLPDQWLPQFMRGQHHA